MGRWGRFLAASVAVLMLPAGCGGADREGEIPAKAKVELPAESIIPPDGGASIPSAGFAALKECEAKMRAGEYRSLADSMDRKAEQAMPRSLAGSLGGRAERATPQTLAICRLCGGVTKINLGLVSEGLADLREAERLSEQLPQTVRTPLETLMFSGQVVGYAAEGDADGVRAALDKLSAVDPQAAERYAEKCAAVRPEGATLPCEAPEPEREPDSSPEDTGEPPSPDDTGPDVVTSPPSPEPPTDAPQSEGPVTEEPGERPPPGEAPPGEGHADGGRPGQEGD